MGEGLRSLTVYPSGRPTLEITLLPVIEGMMINHESVKQMRMLVENGNLVCLNATVSCLIYEEFKAKGVDFTKPATREFYGYEALFKDDSGNWFSLGKRKLPKPFDFLLNRNDLLYFL